MAPPAPVRSIAFTSIGRRATGASSSRKPVRRLTAPAGRSDVASASASSTPAEWMDLGRHRHDRVPPDERREHAGRRGRRRAGSSGARIADDPGRLRHGEVEVRPGDRIGAAEHLRAACPPSPRTRRRGRSTAHLATSRAGSGRSDARASIISASAVEHLPTVVSRWLPPLRECAAGGRRPRRARPCARRAATFCPSASYVRPDSERGNAPPMYSLYVFRTGRPRAHRSNLRYASSRAGLPRGRTRNSL